MKRYLPEASLIVLGIAMLSLGFLGACTDAETARQESWGEDMKVTLWSGGQPVREWVSHGHVASETSSSLLYFKDRETGLFVKVRGNISIEQVEKEAGN